MMEKTKKTECRMVTLRLPMDDCEKLEKQAEAENRSRSNMLIVCLREALAARQQGKKNP